VLVHANLQTGLEVRLRGRTTAGGSDVVNAAITIPAYHGDKFPQNAVLDISGLVSGTPASGYATSGLQYWLVDIVGTNPVTVSIGEVLLVAHWRQFTQLQTNVTMRPRRPVVDNKTPLRVKSTYDLGVTVWEFEAELWVTGSECDALDALWEDSYGKVRPWTWWPTAPTGEPFEVTFVDDAKDVTYKSQTSAVRFRTMRLKLEEVGRGLMPTPSAV
jgi:hypothetical protein